MGAHEGRPTPTADLTASRLPKPRNRRRVSCSDKDLLFADLPPYEPPTKGLYAPLPEKVVPYAELARLEHPGYIIIWLPHTYGMLVAATFLRAPLSQVLRTNLYLIPAIVLLTWANRFWNDFCDAEFDGKVARTRHRPLVRKAVSLQAAMLATCALALGGAMFLIPLPMACAVYAVPMALGCVAYPLSKRVTNLPQVVLGIVLPTGVFMGAASIGATPIPFPTSFKMILNIRPWQMLESSGAEAIAYTYLAIFAWTVLFETIKGYQDAKWDERAGVGTITRVFQKHTSAKVFLGGLAVFQAVMLSWAGIQMEASMIFWVFSVVVTFVALMAAVLLVDLDDTGDSCKYWMLTGGLLSGSAMLIGYASEYYSMLQFVRYL